MTDCDIQRASALVGRERTRNDRAHLSGPTGYAHLVKIV